MSLICPVCGYEKLYKPAYNQGTPSFEYCPCCAYHFGRTDHDLGITYEQWRNKWIQEGMLWNEGETYNSPPPDWNPKEQLAKFKAKNYQID